MILKTQIIELMEAGVKRAEVARRVGVSSAYVSQVARDFDKPMRRWSTTLDFRGLLIGEEKG